MSLKARAGWTALILTIWGCYLRTLNPTFLNNDSAEFLTSGRLLGLSHSPGYPLISLIQRLFQGIPLGSFAWRGSMAAGTLAVLGVILLAGVVHQLIRSGFPAHALSGVESTAMAWGAGFLLAFAPTYWINALTAKGTIYSLQMLFTLGTLRAFGSNLSGGHDRSRGTYALSFYAGLGLAHHWPTQAVLLLALALTWIASQFTRMRFSASPATLLRAASFGLAAWSPLLLYSPLRERFQPALDFGAITTWSRWKSYAGMSYYPWIPSFASPSGWYRGWMELKPRAREIAAFLTQEPTRGWVFIFLAGLYFLSRRFPFQALGTALVALGLIGADLFVNRITGSDTWPLRNPVLGLLLVEIPTVSLFLILLPGAGIRKAVPWIILAAGIGSGVWGWSLSDQSRETQAFRYSLDLFASCPRTAILLAEEDRDLFSSAYLQDVLGKRPDLTVVKLFLWQEEWGVRRWAQTHPDWKLDPLPGADPWDRVEDNLRRIMGALEGTKPIQVTLSRGFVWRHLLQEPTPWSIRPYGLTFKLFPKGSSSPPTPLFLLDRMALGEAWINNGWTAPIQSQFKGVYRIALNNALRENSKFQQGLKP